MKKYKCWIILFLDLQVAIHTLWNIRIVVLAKPEHENRISHIFSDSVKTGIANTLGTPAAPPAHTVNVNPRFMASVFVL